MIQRGTWTPEKEQWLRDNIDLSMEEKIKYLGVGIAAINRKIRLLGLRKKNNSKYQSKISNEQMRYFCNNYQDIPRRKMIKKLSISEGYYYVLKRKVEEQALTEDDQFIVNNYYSMTTKEIAKSLKISVSAVRNRLSWLPIDRNVVICQICNKKVTKSSNRQKYCPECKEAQDTARTNQWGRDNPEQRYSHFSKHYQKNRDRVLQRSYDWYDNFKEENGIGDKKLVSQTQLCKILDKLYPDEECIDNTLHEFLRSPTTSRWLELDRYYPNLKLAFEYDGAQHFEPVEIWGGEETFVEIQRRDKEKNMLCKKQGITLIRIPYTERLSLKNIKGILEKKGVLGEH